MEICTYNCASSLSFPLITTSSLICGDFGKIAVKGRWLMLIDCLCLCIYMLKPKRLQNLKHNVNIGTVTKMFY